MRRSGMAADDRRQARSGERAKEMKEAGEAHACGLRYRSDCECWSFWAGILWWLLRS
ncbi:MULTISPECIES: hypothetical protein [Sphingobium]|uniref:hypothetical protein n=1 Tax=Sphingobium TaxID=165695 RepID=UPI00159CB205|nr:hypothetical protein [Sphingobium sp. 15-1]